MFWKGCQRAHWVNEAKSVKTFKLPLTCKNDQFENYNNKQMWGIIKFHTAQIWVIFIKINFSKMQIITNGIEEKPENSNKH